MAAQLGPAVNTLDRSVARLEAWQERLEYSLIKANGPRIVAARTAKEGARASEGRRHWLNEARQASVLTDRRCRTLAQVEEKLCNRRKLDGAPDKWLAGEGGRRGVVPILI